MREIVKPARRFFGRRGAAELHFPAPLGLRGGLARQHNVAVVPNDAPPLPEVRVPRVAAPGGWPLPEAAWAAAAALSIAAFRPESSGHRPATTLRLLHQGRRLQGRFEVRDGYVRSRHTRFGDPVYRDSCVEIFVQPRAAGGYFNFEFNAGGTVLCCYITNPERVGRSFREYRKLREADARGLLVRTSLPPVVEPERAGPLAWWLEFALPLEVLEPWTGPLGELSGQRWRVNAYKCGNETSHPHWAAWAPVDRLNFHLPHCFGHAVFE